LLFVCGAVATWLSRGGAYLSPAQALLPLLCFFPPPPKTSRSDAAHHIVTCFSPRDLLWLSTYTSSSASLPSSTSFLSTLFHPFRSIIPRHRIRFVSFDLLHIINNTRITSLGNFSGSISPSSLSSISHLLHSTSHLFPLVMLAA
jgi:hypothetical protein